MTKTIADIAVAIVACLHVVFLILESFLWTKPIGRRVFGLSAELASATRSLAMNQGLYNGFLAAGLIYGLVPGAGAYRIEMFFLSCVIVAGIVGSITAKRSILWVQGLPGAVAMALVVLANART